MCAPIEKILAYTVLQAEPRPWGSALCAWPANAPLRSRLRLGFHVCPLLCRATSDPPQEHGGVLAAEGDAVGDGVLDVELAPDVGHVIQIAVGVRFVHVDGGREPAGPHGEQGGGDAGGGAGALRMR